MEWTQKIHTSSDSSFRSNIGGTWLGHRLLSDNSPSVSAGSASRTTLQRDPHRDIFGGPSFRIGRAWTPVKLNIRCIFEDGIAQGDQIRIWVLLAGKLASDIPTAFFQIKGRLLVDRSLPNQAFYPRHSRHLYFSSDLVYRHAEFERRNPSLFLMVRRKTLSSLWRNAVAEEISESWSHATDQSVECNPDPKISWFWVE